MAGEAAIKLGPWKPDAATEKMPRVVEGQSPMAVKKEPDQWAVNAKYAGLPLTVTGSVLYLLYCGVGWVGPNVWIPWQQRILGADEAQSNLIKATAGLVQMVNEKRQTEGLIVKGLGELRDEVRTLREAIKK